MPRKDMRSQILKKESSLLKASAAMNAFSQKSENKVVKEQDIPDELKNRFFYVDDKDLLDDPDNEEDYGSYDDTEELIKAMKRYGFQGVILAYPYKGKYMIESGHRRRYAARAAGITKYPVLKTEVPSKPWEKTIRRIGGNLHNRNMTPMILARQAQRLYEAHKEEMRYKKDNGLVEEGDITNINTLVAIDLEVNDSTVERYRALLRLVPSLQELADSGKIPWMILSTASSMEESKQEDLYKAITERLDQGMEVNSAWLDGTIRRMKLEDIEEVIRPGETGEKKEEVPAPKSRKITAKKVKKNIAALNDALEMEITINDKDIPVLVKELESLRDRITGELEKLKGAGAGREAGK